MAQPTRGYNLRRDKKDLGWLIKNLIGYSLHTNKTNGMPIVEIERLLWLLNERSAIFKGDIV